MICKRLLSCCAILLWTALSAVPQEKAPPLSAAQKRGHELFINSTKGAPCATCHAMANEGTAVGPDLRFLAGNAMPAGVRTAILSSLTSYVVLVKLNDGTTFPAMKVKEQGDNVEYWDLTKTPPENRKMLKKDIESVVNNNQWKHPPESTGYSDEELSDVISYLRYVAKYNPMK